MWQGELFSFEKRFVNLGCKLFYYGLTLLESEPGDTNYDRKKTYFFSLRKCEMPNKSRSTDQI